MNNSNDNNKFGGGSSGSSRSTPSTSARPRFRGFGNHSILSSNHGPPTGSAARPIQELRRPASQAPGPVEVPTVSLPKGGGAVSAIGEKFSLNAATGTGGMAIPIATSPNGRSGFGPTLSLSYSSGQGNGVFGLGWGMGAGSISRKTDKGLPVYSDPNSAGVIETDTFVLSGSEDLVPYLEETSPGTWERRTVTDGDLEKRRYRPRTEGAPSRIYWVRNTTTGARYWEVTTADNVTHIYGRDASARVSDPKKPKRVFRWLLEESRNDRGEVILYKYKAEDLDNVDDSIAEAPRHDGNAPIANTYLKRVWYGNKTALASGASTASLDADDFHFEVVFDYGEHDANVPTPSEDVTWPARLDPFSSYRAGFEVRTYRLCRRVLMFHRFIDLRLGAATLVRSTDLAFAESPYATMLTEAAQSGYVYDATLNGGSGGYEKQSLPRTKFTYSEVTFSSEHKQLDSETTKVFPPSGDYRSFQWVDLDGEGISGVLTEQNGTYRYQNNLGQGVLSKPKRLPSQPSTVGYGAAPTHYQSLQDVTGNGLPDLVDVGPTTAGFFARTDEGSWAKQKRFHQVPMAAFNDPSTRFIDLTGDGAADIMMSGDRLYTWYPNFRKRGYGKPSKAFRCAYEEQGPSVVFAEAEQTVFLADMTGDGLSDLVRVRNGNVCYWPNLGYGIFGAQVKMVGAPTMAAKDLFDPRRIRLADVDGTGPADLIYIGQEGVKLYRNQSGNAFSSAVAISDKNASVAAFQQASMVDLFGTGTMCFVHITGIGTRTPKVKYVDVLNSEKPYLLEEVDNGIGGITRLNYTTSTLQYLADKRAGIDWATKVPFPVHIVESVEHYDQIAKHRFVSSYKYRHGYYDAHEREFRGFGYVEQRDAESVGADLGRGLFPTYTVVNDELPQPPVVTKSWYHTGAFLKHTSLVDRYADEWWSEDATAPTLSEPELPSTMKLEERRQAHRALAGTMLRQEVYAEDGSADEARPYVVSQSTQTAELLQPYLPSVTGPRLTPQMSRREAHTVVRVLPSESLSMHVERQDPNASGYAPRIAHELVLATDPDVGVPIRTASVVYGHPDAGAKTEQKKAWLTASVTDIVHLFADTGAYRHSLPTGAKSYELHEDDLPSSGLVTAATLDAIVTATTNTVDFDGTLAVGDKRILSETRQTYWKNDRTGALAHGTVESKAFPHRSYAKALTSAMVSNFPSTFSASTTATTEGGYVDLDSDGHLWAQSGIAHFLSDTDFNLLDKAEDVYGNETTVSYDSTKMTVASVTNAISQTVTATTDYRLLAPEKVVGINGHRQEAEFDALGRVTAVAVIGSGGQGDTLAAPTTKIAYFDDEWLNNAKPNYVKTEQRETHDDVNTVWLESYQYAGGSGQVVLSKAKVEPGPAPDKDVNGDIVLDVDGNPVLVQTDPRWVGNGRTVVDNKGNPIKQYEPYFSDTEAYDEDEVFADWGVTPVMHYDPLGRVIKTDLPDGSQSRVEFTPWEQKSFDGNDNAKTGNLWYDTYSSSSETGETEAATKATAHADTPAVVYLDALGRSFLTRAHNIDTTVTPAVDEYIETKQVFDIEGNVLSVIDARDITVQESTIGMMGQVLKVDSPDSGERWQLDSVLGEPLRGTGERGFVSRVEYDDLRRATHVWVDDGTDDSLVQRIYYGDSHPTASTGNMLGQVVAHFDQSGVIVSDDFDFKGNPKSSSRQLAKEYKLIVDWVALDNVTDPTAALTTVAAQLETQPFDHGWEYDALNRPTSVTLPDNTEVIPTFNIAGLLETVKAKVRGATTTTDFVDAIAYDEKGRRESIEYASGVTTEYEYDPLTYRLTHFKSTRDSDSKLLQSVAYFYDAVGNITSTKDTATHDVYFDAPTVPSADGDFTYDAVYRLIEALGREHEVGALVQRDENGLPIHNVTHANNPAGLRRYTREYEYGKGGNLTKMKHTPAAGATGAWTRDYTYASTHNRLSSTTTSGGSASYTHDVHGNMTAMAHLDTIEWDFADRMKHVDVSTGAGQHVYFCYSAGGERVRKVYEHSGLREERIYLGGYEVYRKTTISTGVLEEERQTVHISDDARRVCMVETKTVDAGWWFRRRCRGFDFS